MPRDMTEDELREFEEKELHHADKEKHESGPSSESEIVGSEERRPPSGDPEVPPLNPD
jgi:hypothetical protein